MTSRLTLNEEETGSDMEDQESVQPIHTPMLTRSTAQESGRWQLAPQLVMAPNGSTTFGKSVKRKRQVTSLPESDNESDRAVRSFEEDHIVTINSDGEIICPKCGAELGIEEESEEEFLDDEPDLSEDDSLASDVSELEE